MGGGGGTITERSQAAALTVSQALSDLQGVVAAGVQVHVLPLSRDRNRDNRLKQWDVIRPLLCFLSQYPNLALALI